MLPSRAGLCVFVGCVSSAAGLAQTCVDWQPTFGEVIDLDERAYDAVSHDDGTGPALYVGGAFVEEWKANGSGTVLNRIGRWDGTAWSSVGGGVTGGNVLALAVYDDGTGFGERLYAAGSFTAAGGTAASRIAMWDGVAWSALGAGLNGTVETLLVFDDGLGGGPELYAGGAFSSAGGAPANGVARWNGSTWSSLGSGIVGTVRSLAVYDDALGGGPQLYAGGSFAMAGGVAASNVARWDGTAWFPTASGPAGAVNSMTVFDEGTGSRLYVGMGNFVNRWNGATWSPMPPLGSTGVTHALAVHDDGSGSGPSLYAGGGWNTGRVLRWNGVGWSTHLSDTSQFTSALPVEMLVVATVPSATQPSLLASSAAWDSDSNWDPSIRRFGGFQWHRFSTGLDGPVRAIAIHDDGLGGGLRTYLGGSFAHAAGVPANYVVRWDDPGWTPLGTGMDEEVRALAVFDDGLGGGPALYAGGDFTTDLPGMVTARKVAKWDGVNWSTVGAGVMGGDVFAMAVHDDGTGGGEALYVAGSFTSAGGVSANRIARWDGSTWSALGLGFNGTVRALAVYDDGNGPEIYAGGEFTTAGGSPANRVARWNGSGWSALGAGFSTTVRSFAVYDDGLGGGASLYVGGESLGRWKNGAWHSQQLQDYWHDAMLAVDSGKPGSARLYLGTDGGFAVWEGSTTNVADLEFIGSPGVLAIASLESPWGPGEQLVAGGRFETGDAPTDGFVARWGCPAGGIPPWNDECAAAATIGDGTVASDNRGATASSAAAMCPSLGADVWFRYQATCNGLLTAGFCGAGASAGFDSVVAAFTGACGALTSLACSDDACGPSAEVQIGVTAGQVIYLAVGGKNGAQGDFVLAVSIACNPPPANDEPVGAVTIGQGVTSGTNVDATTSAETAGCGSLTSDVWYRFIAPTSGALEAGFCGAGATSSIDTVVAFFSENGGVLTQIACADDVCGTQGSAAVPVAAGQVIYIAVGGKAYAQGSFSLAVDLLANDASSGAEVVGEGLISGSNSADLVLDPLIGSCGGTKDVWYSYLPNCTGTAVVSFCAPGAGANGFDPIVTIFDTLSGAPAEVACNDNTCGPLSALAFPVVAGQRYLIRIASKTGATGTFTFALSCQSGSVRQTQLLALRNTTGPTSLVRVETFPFSVSTIGSTTIANLRGLEVMNAGTDVFASPAPPVIFSNLPIYRLHPITGAATSIGITGVKSLAGLAADASGFLFASCVPTNGAHTHLARISPVNAATTILGPFDPTGTIKDIQGLALHPVSNVLYGTTGPAYDGTPGDLFTLDKTTGAATWVGSLSEQGTGASIGNTLGGLAIDSVGAMYGSLGNNDGRLLVIDPVTSNYVRYGDAGNVSLDGLAAPCPGNELYGKGCAGSGGFTPLLTVTGCSNQGSTITLSVRNALGGSIALLALGLVPATAPLSANCTLNVAPLLPINLTLPMVGAGPGNGAISFPTVLPAVGSPVSITIQALVSDGMAPKGIAASNGFRLDVR